MSHDEEPYRVGKGRPPKEHQYKKGQPSPNSKGRPKGSTRQSQLQKMLKKKVWVTDEEGRRVRKPVQEIIDHRLIEAAAKQGDLKAIKLINELTIMHERFERSRQPTAAEIKQQMAEEEEKKQVSEKLRNGMIEILNLIARLKKLGVLTSGKDIAP